MGNGNITINSEQQSLFTENYKKQISIYKRTEVLLYAVPVRPSTITDLMAKKIAIIAIAISLSMWDNYT